MNASSHGVFSAKPSQAKPSLNWANLNRSLEVAAGIHQQNDREQDRYGLTPDANLTPYPARTGNIARQTRVQLGYALNARPLAIHPRRSDQPIAPSTAPAPPWSACKPHPMKTPHPPDAGRAKVVFKFFRIATKEIVT